MPFTSTGPQIAFLRLTFADAGEAAVSATTTSASSESALTKEIRGMGRIRSSPDYGSRLERRCWSDTWRRRLRRTLLGLESSLFGLLRRPATSICSTLFLQ